MNYFLAALVAGAIVWIQCLVGGTWMNFSLPVYGLLAVGVLITIFRGPPQGAARPRLVCIVVTIVFFAYILARAMLSPVDYLWWPDFYMVLGCLAAYFLTAYYITDSRARTVVLLVLLALALVEVGIGIRQFRVGDEWMPFGFIRAMTGRRASGTFISSIHYAGFLEAIAPFAVAFAFWSKWPLWARIGIGYVAAACYLGVAISGSRGAYLSAAGSLFAFAMLSLWVVRKAHPSRFVLTAVITVGLMFGALAGGYSLMMQSPLLRERLERMNQQFEGKTAGMDIRIYNWQAALDQFRVSPVVGTGAGTHVYYGRLFRRPQLQADPIHAHSDYLEMAAEYGLIGLVGIAIFIVVHVNSSMGGVARVLATDLRQVGDWEPARSNEMALQIGALTAISAYLAHSVVDFNLHIPGNALFFAFIFGMTANPPALAASPFQLRFSGLLRWVAPPLAIWLLISGLPKLPGERWSAKARSAAYGKRFREALTYADRSLALLPGNPEALYYKGAAHRGLARGLPSVVGNPEYEAAADAYYQLLEIFPYDLHAVIRLAETLDDLGRLQEAKQMYLRALQLDPQLGIAHAYYARHLTRVGRQEEAEHHLARARALAHTDINKLMEGTLLGPALP